MKFLLKANSSNGDYDADIGCAYVDIDRDYALQILKRHALFEGVKKEDDCGHEIYFWDYRANYLSHATHQYDVDDDWVSDVDDFTTRGERTECDQMVIRAGGVAWTAMPKHTDIYMTTSELSIETIKTIAESNLEKMEVAIGKPRRRNQRKRA